MNVPDAIEIKGSAQKGKGLFAKHNIAKYSRIFKFEGRLGTDAETNDKSLQIGNTLFLESTAIFDDFLNHSCDPNCAINWQSLELFSIKDIISGEELTYNYNTSEYNMRAVHKDVSFHCNCKANNCTGIIEGFIFLTEKEKQKILPYVSPFIASKLQHSQSSTAQNHPVHLHMPLDTQ